MTDAGIESVLVRLGRGDVTAAGQLYTAYAAYVRAVVRRRFAPHLRTKFDSADVAQSVWAQVVRRVGAGWKVNTEPELRALLAVIARRRLATRARAQPRPAARAGDSVLMAVPARNQASPSQVAHATDLWDRMLRLCAPEHRDILRLRREGLGLDEIAARTGLHEGSVRRVLRRLVRDLAVGEDAVAPPAADASTRR
jgi:RNA polymerase sigma-70 factor (ECF subfamily)